MEVRISRTELFGSTGQRHNGVVKVNSNMPKQQKTVSRAKVVTVAAGIGAVVTMSGLTVAFGDEAEAAVHFGGAGYTSTQTTAPSTVATPLATPAVTTKMWHK
jgi:hypothetical protein